jgi:glycosyltransferase involved in cell wall biosynthesis
LKIVVNTRLLLPGKLDGMGWFTYHTLKRMTEKNVNTEFVFLFDRPWSDEFIFNSNVQPVALFPQARHPFLYYWWFEQAVPAALKKHKADLFLSPDGYLSLSTNTPQVGVMHDLNFEHYPNDLPFITRKYYRHFFPRFARKAKRLATVSEFSKNDIVRNYQIDARKIDVVYNGVDERYVPVNAEVISSIKKKFTNGCSYFLFVGMLHSRKNIANLFKAFEQFKNANPSDLKLLIVGHKKWWTSEMESVFKSMQHQNDVIFSGRVSIEDLVQITASALAMTYVSYFEGFGVPIVEAMRCGVPVITSNCTSMPEVGGDSALLIDPFNSDSIAQAMASVYKNESLRIQLATTGIARSSHFSWEKTTDKLWNCMNMALRS